MSLLLAGLGPSEAVNPTLQHSGSVQLEADVTVFGVACQHPCVCSWKSLSTRCVPNPVLPEPRSKSLLLSDTVLLWVSFYIFLQRCQHLRTTLFTPTPTSNPSEYLNEYTRTLILILEPHKVVEKLLQSKGSRQTTEI